MLDRLLFPLTFLAALGSGLVAGVFFAFSTFVMNALGRLPATQGIAAMQAINIVVVRSMFMPAFMGTALVCILLTISALLKRQEPGAMPLLAGCALYLIGSFIVTVAFNVPMNDALAAVKPDSTQGAELWTRYLSDWTLWNHVRTLASLAATAAFIYALIQFETGSQQLP